MWQACDTQTVRLLSAVSNSARVMALLLAVVTPTVTSVARPAGPVVPLPLMKSCS